MYLVEIEPGREQLYDSVDELATAIRGGLVGPQSRIFHRASSKWISITVHPEFRKAAAARESEPLPPLARKHWTFYGIEPKGREIEEPPATAGATAEQAPADSSEDRRGWRGLIDRASRSLFTARKTPAPSGS